jgi:glycosyltransferase involved in cell wall biosynthesis
LKKVIYITQNYDPKSFLPEPDAEDRFYTFGFGSTLSRKFKLEFPDWEVECWRLGANVKKYHEKTVQGVLFRIFPSLQIKSFGDFSIKFLLELRKEVKKNNPILLLTHIHHWLVYQVTFFFKKSPILVTSHGEYSPYFRYHAWKGLKKVKAFFELQIEKKLLRNIDYFLVCAILKNFVPKEKLKMSSNGVNMDSCRVISKQEARRQLGWDENKKYIIYVGMLYDGKQADSMIKMWLEMKKDRPELELVVIGNSEEDEFNELAAKSGVMLLGRILNIHLYLYYAASDVYVLLSLRDDYFGGIGIAPLECLACGTPVVANSLISYIGNNLDELGEAPNSIEEYKTAILKVIDNPSKYKNMRESVEKYYTWEVISKKTEVLFQRLLKNNSESV